MNKKVIHFQHASMGNPSVLVGRCLRKVPKQRITYEGSWENKEIIIKLFTNPIHGKRHMAREWRGLQLLQERGIDSPCPLFCGKIDKKTWGIVVEKIKNISNIDPFSKNFNHEFHKKMLILLVKLHQNKILQKDLHWGNFLIADNKIYTLDPGQIIFFKKNLSQKKCLENVTIWLAQYEQEEIENLLRLYTKIRQWVLSEKAIAKWIKKVMLRQKKRIQKILKKYHRKNSCHHYISKNGVKAIIDTSFCGAKEIMPFITNIENLMMQGELLKNGGTAKVTNSLWNNKNIVIKRYNEKNLCYSLRQTIKRRRGQISWKTGQHFLLLNIPTPKPLAYIEIFHWGFFKKSYLIMEYMEHEFLSSYFANENISYEKRIEQAQEVKCLLEKLHVNNISHGDLKHTNILITENGPVLIDLDSVTFYSDFLWRYNKNKDEQRFLANAKKFPNLERFFGKDKDA